jgi:hypothetical protein
MSNYLRNKMGIKTHVDLSLTADDWDLYTDHRDADLVANALNVAFNSTVNAGHPREFVSKEMQRIMYAYRTVGATDSEPLRVLDTMLDIVFPPVYNKVFIGKN